MITMSRKDPPEFPQNAPRVGEHWRHIKSGNTYRIVACGWIEATLDNVVIYQDLTPRRFVWVRPLDEFAEKFEFPDNSPFRPTSE